jgi:2-oxoglutarate dehydrogenase E2 component (dihydrolipoamide succinyltransferase)
LSTKSIPSFTTNSNKFTTSTTSSIISKQQYRTYSQDKEVVVNVPGLGDSITEGTIAEWVKNEGDYAEMDEVVVKIATDKVTADVRAPVNCTITKHFAKSDENVAVNAKLFSYVPGGDAPKKEAPKAEAVSEKKEATKAPEPKKEAPKPAAPKPVEKKATPGQREEKRVKMTRIRQRIASRLIESQTTYAMLTTFNEVDMSKLIELRSKYQDPFQEQHGVKLGFMSPFVKAAALALEKYPIVNAVIDGDEIVYRSYVDISVAVATPTGLVVPVLRNVEQKSFADIEKEIAEMSNKARTNSITLEDMQGGTFTISNGGVFGSLMGTPIINPPQSAILGMHATFKRPVAVNDQVVIRPMMYLALTYDHRIIDGREAVTFLKTIKELIEEPARMLLL